MTVQRITLTNTIYTLNHKILVKTLLFCKIINMNKNDLIQLPDGTFVMYSNVLKNSYKQDLWQTFHVKLYDENGEFSGSYTAVNNEVFKVSSFLPYSNKFNPEKLI